MGQGNDATLRLRASEFRRITLSQNGRSEKASRARARKIQDGSATDEGSGPALWAIGMAFTREPSHLLGDPGPEAVEEKGPDHAATGRLSVDADVRAARPARFGRSDLVRG